MQETGLIPDLAHAPVAVPLSLIKLVPIRVMQGSKVALRTFGDGRLTGALSQQLEPKSPHMN